VSQEIEIIVERTRDSVVDDQTGRCISRFGVCIPSLRIETKVMLFPDHDSRNLGHTFIHFLECLSNRFTLMPDYFIELALSNAVSVIKNTLWGHLSGGLERRNRSL